MKSGFKGTFVIPWVQTEMDGQRSAPVAEITAGRAWSWTGEAVRVDGAENVLPLGASEGDVALRKRAALTVRRLIAPITGAAYQAETILQDPLFGQEFVVTDGRETWDIAIIPTGVGRKPLLMFMGNMPPKDVELWIVRHNINQTILNESEEEPAGVICFTPGTMILTPQGPRDVAELSEGDAVQTKDNGHAEILWLGHKYLSGARMHAIPDLLPVRLRAGSLGEDVPDAGLLVSPDHRVVLKGSKARDLFNAEEVLVSARDLIDDHSIIRDHSVKSVHYIHMMLPQHEIVFANGVETESFHPASAELASMSVMEQTRLFDRLPELKSDASSYGNYARRLLSKSDVAILKYA